MNYRFSRFLNSLLVDKRGARAGGSGCKHIFPVLSEFIPEIPNNPESKIDHNQ